MSRFEIKMPKLGESITEGTIIAWNVKVGDTIDEDDVILEVNTAKVSAEIPSPVAGKVIEILYQEGDTIPVGTVIAVVSIGEEDADEPTPATQNPTVFDEETSNEEKENGENQVDNTVEKGSLKDLGRWYSPAVLRLAQEAKIPVEELNKLEGTGYLGRVSKKDIENFIGQQTKGIKEATISKEVNVKPEIHSEVKSGEKPIQISNSTTAESKAIVPESGISISSSEDVVKDMDYVRKLIAEHMVMSKRTSAHVTTVLEADVTKLVHWREQAKEDFLKREGVKLTFMPFVTEAVSRALVDFPQVNTSVEGTKIIYKKRINISIAVSLSDGNLIVPVIRDADKLNLSGLAVNIDSLAKKARAGKLTPTDIEGGTFTITNLGTNGSLFGTPIINQPQVAILGIGLIQKRPAVIEMPEGDVIAIRSKVYLSLSYDHRVIDGALGGTFLRRIADYLENPSVFK